MDSKILVLAAAISIAAAGCIDRSSKEDEAKATAIEMRGAIISGLLGLWRYTNGTYEFKRDGTYDVHFDYMRPAGPGQPDKHEVGDDRGTWSADENDVYFKSAFKSVICDQFKLSPDGLTLKIYPRYVKVPQVLRRTRK